MTETIQPYARAALELYIQTALTTLWLLGVTAGTVLIFGQFRNGAVQRCIHRGLIRARWASVARSTGLAVTKDKRAAGAVSGVGMLALLSGPIDKPSAGTTGGTASKPVERLPKLSHGRASTTRSAVTWRVKPARGQSVDDVAGKSEELAAALGCHQVIVTRDRPNRGQLTAVLRDELSASRSWPGPGAGVGITATGEPLDLPLLGGHWLLAGVIGSGKSAWLNALLAALVTSGTPRYVIGIDPKVVELSAWSPALDGVIIDLPEVSGALVAVHDEIKSRYRRLAVLGRRKLEVPTRDMPLLVVVIDELAELARQAPGEEKTAPVERMRLLSSIAAIGRAAGVVLVVATQRPSAQLIGADLRANLTRRVCCRTTDAYGAEATLGPEASDLKPWLLNPATPGSAWVVSEAHPHPVLARSYWLADEDVDAIVAANPAPRRDGDDGQAAAR